MASPASTTPSSTLPTRTATNTDAVPEEDSSEVTRLFHERLQAWKHACSYLEAYAEATVKAHSSHSKEYAHVLKTVQKPLKEGEMYEQTNGGIAGTFENIRSNTQGISNSYEESSKTLKGSVLPIFERLHAEIKNKTKELTKGAGKGAKLVDKARNESQKHIERLGQHSAAFDSSGGNIKAADDPYILQRQVYHRLNKQVIEENNNRDDLLSVQNNFARFEEHIIQTIQQGMQQFTQIVSNQLEQTRAMYGDMLGVTQRVPTDFEWNGFVRRQSHILIDPNSPKRSVNTIHFANQDHRSTQPLIAGSLEKKGKLLKRYETSFYVVTPSKYMHEFKSDDDFAKDPSPEASLYLPDCLIGATDGVKFNVRGKDAKGGLASKLAMSYEFAFKAHTAADAQRWHEVISSVAGKVSSDVPMSPAVGKDDESMASFPVEKKSEATPASPGISTQGTQETGSVTSPGGSVTSPGGPVTSPGGPSTHGTQETGSLASPVGVSPQGTQEKGSVTSPTVGTGEGAAVPPKV